jgi:hypothetical protein
MNILYKTLQNQEIPTAGLSIIFGEDISKL